LLLICYCEKGTANYPSEMNNVPTTEGGVTPSQCAGYFDGQVSLPCGTLGVR